MTSIVKPRVGGLTGWMSLHLTVSEARVDAVLLAVA